MSQPKWKVRSRSDDTLVLEDTTGVYDPEVEYADEINDAGAEDKDGCPLATFEVFRFTPYQQKVVRHAGRRYLVPVRYQPSWPHPIHKYPVWFVSSLPDIARSHGTTEAELVQALCSDEVQQRVWAYQCIGGHWGYHNLDGYPLTMDEHELEARWDKFEHEV